MAVILQLNDGDAPTYFVVSQKIHPTGHWGERTHAIQFARETDAKAFIGVYLRHQVDEIKVITL